VKVDFRTKPAKARFLIPTESATMTKNSILTILTFTLLSLVLSTASAADATTPPAAKKKAQSIAYQPPLRGAPLSRVGGGTRSIKAADLAVEVLAPEHTGLTLHEQPVFYWYCSKAIEVPVEFALVRPKVPEPVLEVTLKGPFQPGVHAVDLRAHGVKLAPEVDCEWFISVVFDPSQRSNDITAGAGIRLVAASDPLRAALQVDTAQGTDYAQAGIWYDAIAALSASSGDTAALAQRAELLEQVGLGEAVAH